MKSLLFSQASYDKNSFCFRLQIYMGYSTPSLVRFGQVLDPMKKTYFQNLLSQFIRNNCKFPYEKLTFSQASYDKNSFCFRLQIYMGYSTPSLVRFGQVLDPMKKTYFQNLLSQFIRNNFKIPYEKLTFFLGKL